jgi:Tol biopolymer transport system component
VELGGNVDWSPDGNWIAYDAPDAENWTQTWLMRPDGSGQKCLTCDNPASPTPLHIGNPTWHPGMNWIVVQGV